MKRLLPLLVVVLSVVVMSDAAPAGDAAPKGKTIRVKTKTCVAFDLQERLGRDGAPSTWTIAAITAEPSPDSRTGLRFISWLDGATVTGVTVTNKGWALVVDASSLSVTPRGWSRPLPTDGLVNILQAEIRAAFKLAIKNGTLPVGTAVPVVSADGIISGAVTVTSTGSGATPITAFTADERAREDARAAAEKGAPTSKR